MSRSLTAETPRTVNDLELKPCHIICPICQQDGTTDVAVPNNIGNIALIAAFAVLTCCWCLLCMANLQRWTIHYCSCCGVTLGKFEVRSSDTDSRRELTEDVKRATKANGERRDPGGDNKVGSLPVYTVEAEPIVYTAPRRIVAPSPLGPFSKIASEKMSSAEDTKLVVRFEPTGDRVGSWTVTSSDPAVNYQVIVNSFSDWQESKTTQADWDLHPQIVGATTFHVTRQTSHGMALASVSGTIDTRPGNWSTGIESDTHKFAFCRLQNKDCGASNWQLTTSGGTLFWEVHGRTRTLVDTYRRPCAWMKGTWFKELNLDKRLSPTVVDELVGVAVALIVQQQRDDVWENANYE